MNAVIYISGKIGEDSTLLDVIRQYKSFEEPDAVDVYINSIGGDVEEGEAIYSYLSGLTIPVTTITGRAFSIAAKIFAAGQSRIIEDKDNALMIHFAWAKVEGNAEKLELVAETLRGLEDDFTAFYSEFLSIEESAIRSLLDNETFISGSDAVDFGFATEIKSELKAVAELKINQNTNNMKNKKKHLGQKLVDAMAAFVLGDTEYVAELILQDATGTEIVFPELDAESTPAVGDTATVDGAAIADGSHVMPSLENKTVVFEGGAIKEINEPEPEPEAAPQASQESSVNAEQVQEIMVWTVEVINTQFAVGDIVKVKGWEGEEQVVGSGEYQLQDGRRIVTDATGTIVTIKPSGNENDVDVNVEASQADMKKDIEIAVNSATALLKAEYEKKIQALNKKIGSPEISGQQRGNDPDPEPERSQVNVLMTRKKTK